MRIAVAEFTARRFPVVEESGKIIVGAINGVIDVFTTSLFRIDPKTGQRILLSDSENPEQGPPFIAFTYMAIVPNDEDNEDED